MDTINQLTSMIIGIIALLSTVKIIIHCVAMILNIEEKEIYKKKIKNCIIGVIVSSSVFTIKMIVESYFS